MVVRIKCWMRIRWCLHSSVLAWRIPGREEPSGLPSMGLHRVGHDWSNLAAAAAAAVPVEKNSVNDVFLFASTSDPSTITISTIIKLKNKGVHKKYRYHIYSLKLKSTWNLLWFRIYYLAASFAAGFICICYSILMNIRVDLYFLSQILNFLLVFKTAYKGCIVLYKFFITFTVEPWCLCVWVSI